jgi:hypothetical protein
MRGLASWTNASGWWRARLLLAVAVAAPVALAGCGGRQSPAVATLAEYSAALERGDYDAAYQMMADEFRRRHSKDEFMRMLKESPAEVRETIARLRGPTRAVAISAELRYGIGDRLRLVEENGRWRIVESPIAFYSQATPRDALRSFIRAYKLQRWDIILDLVPSEYRERMTVDKVRKQFAGADQEAVAVMMSMLEANFDQPIVEKGAEARMPYGGRYEVEFRREAGKWKIQDPD